VPDYISQLISVVVIANKNRISLIRESKPPMHIRGVVSCNSLALSKTLVRSQRIRALMDGEGGAQTQVYALRQYQHAERER